MHGAAANDRAAAGAGAKFSQSHSNRHSNTLFKALRFAGQSLQSIRQPLRATPADAKESLTRNGINHDVAWKWPPNAGLDGFRPNRRQTVGRRERVRRSEDEDLMVNATARPRFAGNRVALDGPADSLWSGTEMSRFHGFSRAGILTFFE
jgi:hypothetical protein